MSYELAISTRADLQIQKLKKSGNKAAIKKLYDVYAATVGATTETASLFNA